MVEHILKIIICMGIGAGCGWFIRHEFSKNPKKEITAIAETDNEKPIKIYTKIINGKWQE